MIDLPADPIGAAWLVKTYGLAPMGRLPVLSQVGGRRATEVNDGFRLETYLEAMRPAPEPVAHLQFHLRHEVPHLEFLARLFAHSGPAFVQDWVAASRDRAVKVRRWRVMTTCLVRSIFARPWSRRRPSPGLQPWMCPACSEN